MKFALLSYKLVVRVEAIISLVRIVQCTFSFSLVTSFGVSNVSGTRQISLSYQTYESATCEADNFFSSQWDVMIFLG